MQHTSTAHDEPGDGISRRTVLKGAAWSLPVIAVAVSAPAAAASPDSATVEWVGGSTTLLSLRLLSNGGTVSLSVLPSAPTDFRIANTPGVIPNVTATFDVRQTTTALGVAVPIGATVLRGFAPFQIPGEGTAIVGTPSSTTRQIASSITGSVSATDTLTTVAFGDIPSGATLNFGDIVWGVTNRSGISLNVAVATTFSVVVTFLSAGTPFATLSGANITVPAGVSLL